MALKNRKIRRKHRGTRVCGRGKKGSRRRDGGRGLAGSHKHKWTWIIKHDPEHFGHDKMKPKKKPKTVNIGYLNQYAESMDKNEVNALELGFEKVLGGGKVTKALKVKAKYFTESAKQKLSAAGGEAITL